MYQPISACDYKWSFFLVQIGQICLPCGSFDNSSQGLTLMGTQDTWAPKI